MYMYMIVEQEDELANLIKRFISSGYPLTPWKIRLLAYKFAKVNKIRGFSKIHEAAGRSWWRCFRLRYPEFKVKPAKNISLFRALGANKYSLRIFFTMYKQMIIDHGLVNPNQIWNIDESGMGTMPKEKNVLTLAGQPALQIVADEKSKLFTILSYISAGGLYSPPMVVLVGTRVQPAWREWAPAEWMIRCSESGYINRKLFMQYGKFFVDWLQRQGHTGENLVLLDLHKSHLYNAPYLTLMKAHKVSVCSFPPHCTQALQPLDDVPFAQLKKHWDKFLEHHNESENSRALSTREFLENLPKVWEKAMTRPTIVSGWYNTGCYPVRSHAEKLTRLISKCNSSMQFYNLDKQNCQAR